MPRIKGLYVPLYADSVRHPKIRKASKLLGIKPVHMLGHMVALWTWCIEYAQQGFIEGHDNVEIALAAAWEGESDEFVGVITNVGLLDKTDDGLHVHDWPEYGGRILKAHVKNKESQQAFRDRQKDVSLTSDLRKGGDHTIHTRREDTATASRTPARGALRNGDVMLMLPSPCQYENSIEDGVLAFQAKSLTTMFKKIDPHHDFIDPENVERWLRLLLREAHQEHGDLDTDETQRRFFLAMKRVKDRLTAIQDGRKKTAESPERYVRGVFMNVMSEEKS